MALNKITAYDRNTRIQAAVHGRSMEEEARDILRSALSREPRGRRNLAAAIRVCFAPLGGIELPAAFAEQAQRLEPTARALDAAAMKAAAMAAGFSAEVFKTGSAAASCNAA